MDCFLNSNLPATWFWETNLYPLSISFFCLWLDNVVDFIGPVLLVSYGQICKKETCIEFKYSEFQPVMFLPIHNFCLSYAVNFISFSFRKRWFIIKFNRTSVNTLNMIYPQHFHIKQWIHCTAFKKYNILY